VPNIYQIGRLGRVYVAQEPSFGTAATLAATDAVRVIDGKVKFNQNPRNRVNSKERHAHPSQIHRHDRRKTADWMLGGVTFPSGTLNTLPDMDPILKSVFGQVSNITLSTTATGSPTTTTIPCASVTGLAVGQAVLVNISTASTGRVVRWITAINTLTLTVAPAMPAAPAAGDTVKGCITYSFTTAPGSSLNMANYLTSKSYEIKGGVPENLKLTFDSNDEVSWEASGPAKARNRPAQTDPATYTVVGTTPPSGLTGSLRIGATAEEFVKASFEIKNGLELDNIAFGTSEAQAMYRKGKRAVTASIDARQSDDVTIEDLSESNANTAALLQCGTTEGSIVAVYMPTMEIDTPEDADSDEERMHSFKALLKGTSGNDEMYLAFA
jgi:hypothetical protein